MAKVLFRRPSEAYFRTEWYYLRNVRRSAFRITLILKLEKYEEWLISTAGTSQAGRGASAGARILVALSCCTPSGKSAVEISL